MLELVVIGVVLLANRPNDAALISSAMVIRPGQTTMYG
jgi:hypothetical protein